MLLQNYSFASATVVPNYVKYIINFERLVLDEVDRKLLNLCLLCVSYGTIQFILTNQNPVIDELEMVFRVQCLDGHAVVDV